MEIVVNEFLVALNETYSDTAIKSVLEFAINGGCKIYFLNNITGMPQQLTPTQLAGIKKFGGVNIVLETGQTYQIGLEIGGNSRGTYQEIYFDDLVVDHQTLIQLRNEFGDSDR
jgi:hypothetical protein